MESMNKLNFPQRVQHAFSRAASRYDLLTQLHKEIGRELLQRTFLTPGVRNFALPVWGRSILDVGTGTGYLARKAKGFFPEAVVIGLDSASGMIEQAAKAEGDIQWILAEAAALPFRPSSFDAVISNLAYQWVEDLPRAFGESFTVTKDGGVLAVTLFGFNTKSLLFIDHNQSKVLETDIFGQQPVRSDHHIDLTFGNILDDFRLFAFCTKSAQHLNLDRKIFDALAEIIIVLLS